MCSKSKVKSNDKVSEEQVEEVKANSKAGDVGRGPSNSKMRIFEMLSL